MQRWTIARIFRKGCNDRESWKHEVLVTERKQMTEFQTLINTSKFDDKCGKEWKCEKQYCFKNWNFASQKRLNCISKAKFVHTKWNHQSWHPNRCACFLRKNFALFLEENTIVWLRSVAFEIDNFEISCSLILVKSFVSSWRKEDLVCKLSFFCSLFTTAEKNARSNDEFFHFHWCRPWLP